MLPTVISFLSPYVSDQRLDAEVLLMHVLNVSRAYLHAYPDHVLTLPQQNDFNALMSRHLLGEPVAYLTGQQAFWSLNLQVTPATLIPRPETELLVELTLELAKNESMLIADLGTGSGAIALALAREIPHASIYATDKSPDALRVAKNNADVLMIQNVQFREGYWCRALPDILFDVIVSNPPYIGADDIHLTKSVYDYEPPAALFSANEGLSDICHLISEAMGYLKSGGYLLLEHGFQQAKNVRDMFADMGYTDIKTAMDLAGHHRVTWAVKA